MSENALVCLTNKEATVVGPSESGNSDEKHTKMLLTMAGARTPLFLAGVGSIAPFLTVVRYLRGLT